MHSPKRFALWGLATLLVGSLGLSAQEAAQAESKFSADWKTRVGYAPSSKDNLRNSFLGFGLNLGYGLGAGKVGLELGYFYKTGDNYLTMPDASRIASGTPVMNPDMSMEDRRNEQSGLTVRLSYQQDFNETFGWQAGLQLGTHFKHQYIGDCQSMSWSSYDKTQVSDKSWRDLYNGVPNQGGLNPSPYLGILWHADKTSTVEFNALILNYQSIYYHHYAGVSDHYALGIHQPNGGSGAGSNPWCGPVATDDIPFSMDRLDKKTRLVPHFEITYTFHF